MGLKDAAEGAALDRATSNACLRSGIFILILTGIAITLVFQWIEQNANLVVGEYFTHRNNLKLALELLELDNCWKEYKRLHPNADEQLFSELLEIDCARGSLLVRSDAPDPQPQNTPVHKTTDSKKPQSIPERPDITPPATPTNTTALNPFNT